jgi:signal transduction histidine kinase/ligand-binding sensor domain-containing protein
MFVAILAGLPATAFAQDQIPPPPAQPARFERISTADGLSFPWVNAVLQDHQGYMWFATRHGLNRYDGHEFTVYTHDPGDPTSIRNEDVDIIFEDSDRVLWVGHGGGLDRFDRERETFTHVDTRGQVFSIYEDSTGTLWVGFWHGLYGYDRATNEMIFSRQPDPDAPDDWSARSQSDSAVLAIYEDQRADLWIGTVAGLARLDRDTATFTRYRHDPDNATSLSSDVVRAIYEDRQSTLWIGTGGGLDRLDPSSGTFTHFWYDPEGATSILEDSAGVMWIGTVTGLAQLDPSTNSGQAPSTSDGTSASGQAPSQDRLLYFRHNPRDPLSLCDNAVLSLHEDRAGVLWIATANGVSKYIRRSNQFTVYRESPAPSTDTQHPPGALLSSGLSDGRVLAIYEDRDGTLWIGTSVGGLNRSNRQSGEFTVYQHDPTAPASLSSNSVNAIYQDHAGILWIGTSNGWLERFDPATETFIHHLHVGESEVADIAEDPAGNLWIGTWGEGLYRLAPDRENFVHYEQHWREPNHWKQYGSLSSHITWAITIDQAGVPWVGTYHGGINLWDSATDRFTHYRHDPANPDSLGNDYVLSFWEDPAYGDREGVMWIGTMGGLNRLDRDTQTFTRYTVEDGLPHNIVDCILGDNDGFLWLGTPKGLSRFDPRTEAFRNYDERDGIITGMSYPEVCFRSRTGEMFFGGGDGFYAFDPGQITDNLHVPPIVITALQVFNQTTDQHLPADKHIRFSHSDNYLSFEFAALDYSIPEKNQYAYKMEGLDKEWVYAGTRRHADYPDLKPGDYVFRVRGSNNDGVWNDEGTAVYITVEPPVWQTWPFRVLVAVALVVGGIGVYRQRVRNIEARSRELESQVQERTTELQQEIDQRTQAEEALRQSERERAIAEERNRLARELHDSVTQSLYAVTLYADAATRFLSSGQGESASDNLHKLRRTAREALGEMRLLIFELRPPILEHEGLAAALQARLEAVEGRSGLRTEFHVEGKGQLPPDVEEGLYRIALEVLNNALKHAQASRISVSLRLEEKATVLELEDDGVGFDLDVAWDSGGMGLQGVAERAAEIGGELVVESEPGEGTRVQVSLASRRDS